MQIIAKRTFICFSPAVLGTDGKPLPVQPAQQRELIQPNQYPQIVPDWVRDSPTFQHAQRDGGIMEITSVSTAPTVVRQAGIEKDGPVGFETQVIPVLGAKEDAKPDPGPVIPPNPVPPDEMKRRGPRIDQEKQVG